MKVGESRRQRLLKYLPLRPRYYLKRELAKLGYCSRLKIDNFRAKKLYRQNADFRIPLPATVHCANIIYEQPLMHDTKLLFLLPIDDT